MLSTDNKIMFVQVGSFFGRLWTFVDAARGER